jgi:hypothetical protein
MIYGDNNETSQLFLDYIYGITENYQYDIHSNNTVSSSGIKNNNVLTDKLTKVLLQLGTTYSIRIKNTLTNNESLTVSSGSPYKYPILGDKGTNFGHQEHYETLGYIGQ